MRGCKSHALMNSKKALVIPSQARLKKRISEPQMLCGRHPLACEGENPSLMSSAPQDAPSPCKSGIPPKKNTFIFSPKIMPLEFNLPLKTLDFLAKK